MSMSIGGATVALVENKHGGMYCEAHPTRLALVLSLINSGAIGLADSYYGSDGHKAALLNVQQHVAQTLENIEKFARREAYLLQVRAPWIESAAARYVERGELDADEAKRAAASLFSLVATDSEREMPNATDAADEDMATWTA